MKLIIKKTVIKRLIGTILVMLFFPTLIGVIYKLSEDNSFIQGFTLGLYVTIALVILVFFILLIMWLFDQV